MILADTSVWIDHFRKPLVVLNDLLRRQVLLMHPLVVGELAMGSLKDRSSTLEFLDDLPRSEIATDDEARGLVEREGLYGTGLGYVDAHLLSSAMITPDCRLWTLDKRLRSTAERLDSDARFLH